MPTQKIEYLGFVINSVDMTVSLTNDKKLKIKQFCDDMIQYTAPSIRLVAQLLGKFTSNFPAVRYGQLHYRALEREKIYALQRHKGNFDKPLILIHSAIEDILWWRDNVLQSFNTILPKNPMKTLSTDACNTGWGAVLGGISTGGMFSLNETVSY